jgi:hypothetical protein
MVAPSLVIVTSPILSTNILSSLYSPDAEQSFSHAVPTSQISELASRAYPTGPKDDFKIFDTV